MENNCKINSFRYSKLTSPSSLLKSILTGELTELEIKRTLFDLVFTFPELKRTKDINRRAFLMKTLSSDIYYFYKDPSSWIFNQRPNCNKDVAFISTELIKNSKCEMCLKKIDGFNTLIELQLLNLKKADFENAFEFVPEKSILALYQQLKYRLVYNGDFSPLEILTENLFRIKPGYYYEAVECNVWVDEAKLNTDVVKKKTFIETVLHLDSGTVEI